MPLDALDERYLLEAGGKAVTLGRMARAGLPVPRGFVITTRAFHRFLESVPGWQAMAQMLARLDQATVAETSRHFSQVLAAAPVPVAVSQEIEHTLAEWPHSCLWAVRSSATAEDSLLASFAGQHDSFLNTLGSEVPAQVRRCWVSLFTPRALSYRQQAGLGPASVAMAVIVQEMVAANVGGVLFTADPASGVQDRIYIEAALGLGDQVVSGRVTPDRVVLHRPSLEVLDQSPGTSTGSSPALHLRTARELARLALRAEQLLQRPVDVEWALCREELHLLQARPITSRPKAPAWEDRQIWTNINAGEVVPDVVTPMTWSVLQVCVGWIVHPIFRLLGAKLGSHSAIGLVGGRVYGNVNTFVAALRPLRFSLLRIHHLARALGGAQEEMDVERWLSMSPEDLPDLGCRWYRYLFSSPRMLRELIAHSPKQADRWIARLKQTTDQLVSTDVRDWPPERLVQFFNRQLREGSESWDLLYLMTQAAVLPVFQKACRDWLQDPDLTLGYRLFSSLGGVPEAEAGLALWDMAALVHRDPGLTALLSAGQPWQLLLPELQKSGPGRHLVSCWNDFMRVHGHHCRGELELGNARWCESPDYVLGLIRAYLNSARGSDLRENQRRLAAERLRLTRQCQRRLRNPVKRWIFSRALARAQVLAVMREEWKNQAVRRLELMRRVLLTLGQRLESLGRLSKTEDIFFLEPNELDPASAGAASREFRERIEQRRAEYVRNQAHRPPRVVKGRFSPQADIGQAVDGNTKVLKGISVSPGLVVGRARVILRSDDHEHVLPGEILVAPFTDPAWTPYFVTAAGVVMDQGGILSHGSIVAREYGLPAVTNAGCATQLVRTGDLIEVDGNAGTVTIVQPAHSRPPLT